MQTTRLCLITPLKEKTNGEISLKGLQILCGSFPTQKEKKMMLAGQNGSLHRQ